MTQQESYEENAMQQAPILPLIQHKTPVFILAGDYKGLRGSVDEIRFGYEIESESNPRPLAEIVIDLDEVEDMDKHYPHLNGTSVSSLLFDAADTEVAYQVANGCFINCKGEYAYGEHLTRLTPEDIENFYETLQTRVHSLGSEFLGVRLHNKFYVKGEPIMQNTDDAELYGELNEITVHALAPHIGFDIFLPYEGDAPDEVIIQLITLFKEAGHRLRRYEELLDERSFLFPRLEVNADFSSAEGEDV